MTKLLRECAEELIDTYPHIRSNLYEIVEEWLSCGEDLGIDADELCDAVEEFLKDND